MRYKILIILRIAFSVGLASFLMYHYFENKRNRSIFWGPYLIVEIVLDLSCGVSVIMHILLRKRIVLSWESQYIF